MGASNNGLFAPRCWRLAVLTVLALAVVVAAFAISGRTYRLRNVAEHIERPASRLLGFDVSIRGPAYVRLSLPPVLTLRDVHLRDAHGRGGAEALVVRDVSMRFDPWSLVRDRWSITRLELTDARICVSLSRGSACDWRQALTAIDRITNIDHLTIRRVRVRCTGGACGEALERQVGMIRANLSARRDMQLSVYEQEKEQDVPVLEVTAAPWSVFRSDRPWRVRGSLRSGDAEVDFAGVIQHPRELAGANLDFDARTDLGRWHEVALGKLRVHGDLAEEARGYRLLIEEGQWGTGTVRGEVHVRRSDPGWAIDGSVVAHHLDLDPWVDAPTQGEAAGGYANVDVRFTTSGSSVKGWREHLRGRAVVAAGPAELPIEQVERWSKGFLKFVFALPAEGAATRIKCMRGEFDLRGVQAVTHNMRIDTVTTQMRAAGSLSLRNGRMDFLVKPHLNKGPLKDAPLVAVSGKIEQPVTRLASRDESARSEAEFARMPVAAPDSNRPCG